MLTKARFRISVASTVFEQRFVLSRRSPLAKLNSNQRQPSSLLSIVDVDTHYQYQNVRFYAVTLTVNIEDFRLYLCNRYF
jgi:hypothetical protein